MELPAQLQELLLEGGHLDPELAGQAEKREVVAFSQSCRRGTHEIVSSNLRQSEGRAAGTPLPGFSQLFILKGLKVACFHTLLQVFILKPLTSREYRLKPVPLSRKGAAATAITGGVGILEDESLAHQR